MQKHFAKLLAVAAVALITAGFVDEAHAAAFKIRLDNNLTSGYTGATTSAQVIVRAYFDNGGVSVKTGMLTSLSESHDFTFNTAGQSWQTISYIEVSLDSALPAGNDLLILDQVQLYDENNSWVTTYGAENDQGYCVSWESSDGSNSHCHDGQAWWARTFTF